jgi:hypothetical protein
VSLSLVTLAQRPELAAAIHDLHRRVWPRFLQHSNYGGRYWGRLFTDFAAYQVVLLDGDEVAAVGNTLPLPWDGTVAGLPDSWDEMMERGALATERGQRATTLAASAAVVAPERQGQGLSRLVLRGMKAMAADHGFDALVAPVRPTLKSRYPLTPIERYAAWTDAAGRPFDPWLRTHARLGAEIVRLAPRSMLIDGTVAEWEEWTAMRLPESGDYIVPGALQPVTIDRERDRGEYFDPNVWMRHPVAATEAALLTAGAVGEEHA